MKAIIRLKTGASSRPTPQRLSAQRPRRAVKASLQLHTQKHGLWGEGFTHLRAAAAAPRIDRGRQLQLSVRAEAFDSLNKSLSGAWKKLKGESELSASNMKEPLRDIRRALLEADVSLPVVRRFVKRIEESAVGIKVLDGVEPEQMLVKVVSDELISMMGKEMTPLKEKPGILGPTVILMAGLQGVGKTTMCGKLALYLQGIGKKVCLVATDVYRPAAIDQLVSLGKTVGAPVFELGIDVPPAEIAKRGIEDAKKQKADYVIVDTAGRLSVDEAMMEELRNVRAAVNPDECLLVVDAMTGQEAAQVVKSFNDEVELTGAILTKLDGDSRGGAALSVYEVSKKPIKFVGTGEKMEMLEPFYPDRMAGRILGQGDVLTLVERMERMNKGEEERMEQQAMKMMSGDFDFNDFISQMKMMENMGSMGSMIKMMPGIGDMVDDDKLRQAEMEMAKFSSVIDSMTPKERKNPKMLATSPSRRARIARGSGRTEMEVTNMVGRVMTMRKQFKIMGKMTGGNPNAEMDEDMMAELSGRSSVSAGKVRRKKKSKKPALAKSKGFA